MPPLLPRGCPQAPVVQSCPRPTGAPRAPAAPWHPCTQTERPPDSPVHRVRGPDLRSEAPASRRSLSAHGRSVRSMDARTRPLPGAFTRGPASVSHEGEKAGMKHHIKKLRSWQIEEEHVEDLADFSGPKISWSVTADNGMTDTCSMEGELRKPRQHVKKQRRCVAHKGLYSQSYGFPVVTDTRVGP